MVEHSMQIDIVSSQILFVMSATMFATYSLVTSGDLNASFLLTVENWDDTQRRATSRYTRNVMELPTRHQKRTQADFHTHHFSDILSEKKSFQMSEL
jgi:hypothetical protein